MRRFTMAAMAGASFVAAMALLTNRSQASPLSPEQDAQPRMVIWEFFSKPN